MRRTFEAFKGIKAEGAGGRKKLEARQREIGVVFLAEFR
jgi:hypothetical protein